jgi:hypothetical protein
MDDPTPLRFPTPPCSGDASAGLCSRSGPLLRLRNEGGTKLLDRWNSLSRPRCSCIGMEDARKGKLALPTLTLTYACGKVKACGIPTLLCRNERRSYWMSLAQ